MIGKRIAETVLIGVVMGVLFPAQLRASGPNKPAKADLRISNFVFPDRDDKVVRVYVVNAGGAASTLCILRLTVRKMNGVPVGRVVEIKLPPLAAGEARWLGMNAASILPNNVSLKSTTFKLNADATSMVAESDEANNEVWHNL